MFYFSAFLNFIVILGYMFTQMRRPYTIFENAGKSGWFLKTRQIEDTPTQQYVITNMIFVSIFVPVDLLYLTVMLVLLNEVLFQFKKKPIAKNPDEPAN